MTNLTVLVLLAPLLGFVILGVAGSALTNRAIITVAWGGCGLAFLCQCPTGTLSILLTSTAAR